jgi:hypothetical protein
MTTITIKIITATTTTTTTTSNNPHSPKRNYPAAAAGDV